MTPTTRRERGMALRQRLTELHYTVTHSEFVGDDDDPKYEVHFEDVSSVELQDELAPEFIILDFFHYATIQIVYLRWQRDG